MLYIGHTQPHLLIADEGKKIRLKEDIYKESTETEEEHMPYYTSMIFPADNLEEEQLRQMYVEEEV